MLILRAMPIDEFYIPRDKFTRNLSRVITSGNVKQFVNCAI